MNNKLRIQRIIDNEFDACKQGGRGDLPDFAEYAVNITPIIRDPLFDPCSSIVTKPSKTLSAVNQ